MKDRLVTLKAKTVNWLIQDNRISVKYDMLYSTDNIIVDTTYVNFTPSTKLMKLLDEEVHNALKSTEQT